LKYKLKLNSKSKNDKPKEPFNLVTFSEYSEMINKVDNLQKDIALAVRNNDLYKASRLATILSRSKAAQVVAIRRVLFNKGSSNKGMGKKVLKTNEEYKQLLDELRQIILRPSKYKATPFLNKKSYDSQAQSARKGETN
jgi:hypothetical protein